MAYKLHMVQKLQEIDLLRRYDFAIDILPRIMQHSGYLGKMFQ
jgi:hypothetical protein